MGGADPRRRRTCELTSLDAVPNVERLETTGALQSVFSPDIDGLLHPDLIEDQQAHGGAYVGPESG